MSRTPTGTGASTGASMGPGTGAVTGTAKSPSSYEITSRLLTTVPQRFPALRVWRVNVMGALNPHGRIVRTGPAGLADISGIGPGGVRIEIEVKAGRDRMRPEQESFRRMVLERGGIHIIARDVDGALDELGRELAARGHGGGK